MLRLYFVLRQCRCSYRSPNSDDTVLLVGQVTGYMRILGSARYAFGFLFMDFTSYHSI